MKVLILTQYFPPETGAPQNRLFSLASHLKEMGAEVSVLTAMPNYPKMEISPDYKGKLYDYEVIDGINIYRSWIFVKKTSSIFFRLINYFSFVFSSLITGIFKIKKHDVIICESPPLFLGISALGIKWVKGSKLIFNVSDLWPESAEKLGLVTNKFFLGISYKLEAFLYKSSALVSGQTYGIIKSINDRFPEVKTHLYRNGVDFNNVQPGNGQLIRHKYGLNNSDFVLAYAGIIGHAQGLEVIIKAANIVKAVDNIKFLIVGDGPVKEDLQKMAHDFQLSNVVFVPNIPKAEVKNVIATCNAYIVPLKKMELFMGAIPSKIFDPLAHGKAVLLGVDGEARDLFVEQGQCALHFEPENEEELAKSIGTLYDSPELSERLGQNGYNFVRNNFDRKILTKNFMQEIERIV